MRNEHKGDCAGDSWRRYLLTTRLAQSENTLKTSVRLFICGGAKGILSLVSLFLISPCISLMNTFLYGTPALHEGNPFVILCLGTLLPLME